MTSRRTKNKLRVIRAIKKRLSLEEKARNAVLEGVVMPTSKTVEELAETAEKVLVETVKKNGLKALKKAKDEEVKPEVVEVKTEEV